MIKQYTFAPRAAFLLLLGLAATLSPATAFDGSRFTQGTVEAAFLSEALSLPSFRVVRQPIHPGSMVAYEYPWRTFDRSHLFIEVNTGFYLHEGFQNGILLGIDVGYNYSTQFGLGGSISAGIGYLHTVYPGAVYEHNDGTLEQVRDFGKPHLMVSLPLEINYDLDRVSSLPITPYVQYRPFVEIPGITGWSTYAIPHASFMIGTKIDLDNCTQNGGAS